jgi:gamma-glutamylcyclotransferase (GGCT)/AIG2-like uncharacterized protein YtfP
MILHQTKNHIFGTATQMINFFAYGTLQLPEVMLAVVGRSFNSQAARLDDFARYRLRGKSFPGIRPELGSKVDGLVYCAIDNETLESLDAFEDAFYHRESVTIITADGIAWAAETYVMSKESHGMLLPEEWCLEEFRREKLPSFLLVHE